MRDNKDDNFIEDSFEDGYDPQASGTDGYGTEESGADGYDSEGYADDGYGEGDYDSEGYAGEDYAEDGYSEDGYDRDGYDSDGYAEDGYDRDGYDSEGYADDGYSEDDYGSEDYADGDYDSHGYAEEDYDSERYAADEYETADYDPESVESPEGDGVDTASVPEEELEPYYDHEAFKWLKTMNRAKLIRLCAMLVFSVAVLIFASIAWFTMNKDAGTSGMGVRTAGMPFELGVDASYTNVGIISYHRNTETDNYDGTELNSIAELSVANGASDTYSVVGQAESVNLYHTGSVTDNLKWRLSGSYNESGLGPDSGGALTFYVIPNTSGSLDINFSISLDGYTAVESKNENRTYDISNVAIIPEGQNTAPSKALKYLRSHILFFAGMESDGIHYKQLIDPSSFTLSEIKGSSVNATKDVAIPVTIYWEWANTFGQMVLSKSDNPADKEALTLDDNLGTIRDYVLENADDIFEEIEDVADPTSLMKKNGVFDIETTLDSIRPLSLAYNKADQEIGINIDYVLVSLKAE